jgi:hypothetical protein
VRTLATFLAAAAALFAGSYARALTIDDCELWIGAVQTEASSIRIAGDHAADDRQALLHSLDQARKDGRAQRLAGSAKGIETFRKRAAALAASGRVSKVEGDRLMNLGDTMQHCIEQLRAGSE